MIKIPTYTIPNYRLSESTIDSYTVGTFTVPAWKPEDLGSKLILAYDSFDASRRTMNGGDVAALLSYGTYSTSLVQSTAAKQPLLASGWDSKDVAVFDRTAAQILQTGAVTALDNPASIGLFVVIRPDTWAAPLTYMGGVYGSGTRIELYWAAPTTITAQIIAGGVTTNKNITVAAGTKYAIYMQINSSGVRRVWSNGIEIGTATAGAVPIASAHVNTAIGGRFNDTYHSNLSMSHMSITTELTDAEVSDYMDWAA